MECFAVQSVKCLLLYASLPVVWNKIESVQLLRVPSTSCLEYYSGVRFGNNNSNTQRAQQKVA